MWRYALRRLGLALVIVLVAMAMLFGMLHLVPGDPASIALGPRATPEMREEFRVRMGLDRPIPVQFARFVGNALRGDLGTDVWSRQPVARLVWLALPHTAALTTLGIGWAILLGIPLGCFSALHRGSWLDRVTGVLSVSAIAIPSFIVAIYALLVFAVWLEWFPAIGAGTPGDVGSRLRHLVLPSFAIGLGWVGFLARLVRASMLEVLGEPHIRAARAFGLPERRIVYQYALKLAILPTVALLGVGVGRLLSGAVFAEIVFARPGLGRLVYDGVISRNYPVVMGTVLVTTWLFVLSTLVADLVAALLDPRVRERL
ncbi:MAG: ABC transporter permease [Candidatus Rokubacteria bacterium]|nr:ABC transporter permease [Candidatus Rokubacteria bacterium]